jgi:hypothetical protein
VLGWCTENRIQTMAGIFPSFAKRGEGGYVLYCDGSLNLLALV